MITKEHNTTRENITKLLKDTAQYERTLSDLRKSHSDEIIELKRTLNTEIDKLQIKAAIDELYHKAEIERLQHEAENIQHKAKHESQEVAIHNLKLIHELQTKNAALRARNSTLADEIRPAYTQMQAIRTRNPRDASLRSSSY